MKRQPHAGFERISLILLSFLALSVQSVSAGVLSDPVINEFVANHTGTDTSAFIEILGGPSTDYSAYTLLEIEGDSGNTGNVDAALPVGVTDAAGYWTDPEDMENGTITILLVEGWSGSVNDDLDTNDDGIIDVTPWTRIVDDVAVNDGGASDLTYSSSELSAFFDGQPFAPGGASRIPNGFDTDATADWVRNNFDGDGLPCCSGTAQAGEAVNTPGAENVEVLAFVEPLINEFVANHTGTDTSAFIEILGGPSTDYSAYTLLEIEGDSGNTGNVDAALPVGVTDAAGYWTDPEDMENGTITILLVEGWSGSVNDDLDTNDDGIIDVTPWTRIVDDVAVNDGGASDLTYSSSELSAFFDGQPFAPGGASRIPNGFDTDATADWVRNNFDGDGLPCCSGTAQAGEAVNTPGAENMEALAFVEPVINEIMQNPSAVADGSGEWFELYNPGGVAIDINGWTIEDDGTDSHVINNGGPLMLPAGGYLVLGNNGDAGTNGGVSVDYVYGGWFLSNGGDEVVLLDGSLVEIDRVNYDGGPNFPDPTGASMSLIDPALDNNVGANWCESTTPFGAGDLGTPGEVNTCLGPTAEVYINELRINKTTPQADFFEIQGVPGTSLDGLTYIVLSGEFEPGQIDFVIGLTGSSIPADGFFVAAGAATAAEYGITPDLGAEFNFFGSPSTHLIVSGFEQIQDPGLISGDLDTNNDGVLDIIPWDSIIDSVSLVDGDGNPDYSYSDTVVGPDGSFTPAGTYRCGDAPAGTFGNNQLDFGSSNGTPGESNGPLCVLSLTLIHDIQGTGLASPMVGATVAIEGIVVGDFQDGVAGTNGDFNGFHVQEEDTDADANSLTSEGIFIFDGSSPAVDVQIGDLVRVEGTVAEFGGLTELTSVSLVSVISSGNPLPALTAVTLPVASVDDFEAFEGMYVTLPQDLFITEYFNFDRYNEVALSSIRLNNATADNDPGPAAIAAAADFLLDRITLDDGRGDQNPDPARHPDGTIFDLTNVFRGGDSLSGVTGVMDFARGLYRIQPTQGAVHSELNPRTLAPDAVGGSLKVASFNVLNYFTTLDGDGSICGPNADQGCRGADNAEEFTRQRDKIIAALVALDADVVGLIELENHPGDDPTADLVSGLNDVLGAGTYDFIPTGAIGEDVIRQALIYQPANATPDGPFAILDSSVDATFNDVENRPVLAQTFRDNVTTGRFTVAVNHLKSKGSDCNALGDPDTGDGSGNCNITRTTAAAALANWLVTDPTGSGDDDALIIGDLNAYDMEDPIDALAAGGFTDLANAFIGNSAYSFVFSGTGYLDYALAGANLLGEVTGTTIWHINADESDLIDYNTDFKQDAQDALYAPDPYRASDHDPVVVGLDLVPVADLSITKTASPEPVVAGGLLTYTVTVSNAGPDDAFDVVVTDNLTTGLSLVSTSGCSEDTTGVPTCTLGRIDAGADAQYTIVATVDAGLGNGTILTNSAVAATSSFDPDDTNNTSAPPTLTTVITEAYWDVTKYWNRGGSGSVSITLTCNGVVQDTGVANPGVATTLTATGWVNGATSCVVTEDVPGGTFEEYSVDCSVDDVVSNTTYICDIGNSESFATFAVRKRFMDGNDETPVTFHMDCNNGLPTEQQLTVFPDTGDFDRGSFEVNFVVTKFAPGEMDCTVYEEPVGGYTASYVCGSVNNPDQECTDGDDSPLDNFGTGPCFFEDVDSSGAFDSINYCTIRNYPNPGEIEITKEWIIEGAGGNLLDLEARVEIVSGAEVEGSYPCRGNQWCTSVNFYGPETTTHTLDVETSFEGTVISLEEDVYDSTFMSENDCGNELTVYPTGYQGNDGKEQCTFTNTAFFEGIPTLNQYGMALLALLMLGVGLAGFRRM